MSNIEFNFEKVFPTLAELKELENVLAKLDFERIPTGALMRFSECSKTAEYDFKVIKMPQFISLIAIRNKQVPKLVGTRFPQPAFVGCR